MNSNNFEEVRIKSEPADGDRESPKHEDYGESWLPYEIKKEEKDISYNSGSLDDVNMDTGNSAVNRADMDKLDSNSSEEFRIKSEPIEEPSMDIEDGEDCPSKVKIKEREDKTNDSSSHGDMTVRTIDQYENFQDSNIDEGRSCNFQSNCQEDSKPASAECPEPIAYDGDWLSYKIKHERNVYPKDEAIQDDVIISSSNYIPLQNSSKNRDWSAADNDSRPSTSALSHSQVQKKLEIYPVSMYSNKNNSNNSEKDVNVDLQNDKSTLNVPQKIHPKEKSFPCDICHKSFTRNSNLKAHRRTHYESTREKPFQCDICHKSFTKSSNLNAHKRLHSRENLFQCDVCHESFPRNSKLVAHKRIHTGENPYQCDICYKIFSKTSHLTAHRRIHTGEKPFQCYICLKSFTQNSELNVHKKIHSGEKPFLCVICHKSFALSSTLKSHLKIHSDEKPFQCDICHKSFTQNKSLKVHLKIHLDERPFQCDNCQKSFTQNSHLKAHMKLHSGEKPFQCNICCQSFTQNSHLKAHLKIHSGEKPFQCEVCSRAFTQNSHLKVHLKIHSEEKPFLCDICNKTFKHPESLTRHKRTHSQIMQSM